MFGWINDCTECLVISKYGGEEVWHKIKEQANCQIPDGGFLRYKYYPDSITVDLVVAGAQVLGITIDEILYDFGLYFIDYARVSGYSNVLECLGGNFRDWLCNLDTLHDNLKASYPKGFVVPVFWSEDEHDDENDNDNDCPTSSSASSSASASSESSSSSSSSSGATSGSSRRRTQERHHTKPHPKAILFNYYSTRGSLFAPLVVGLIKKTAQVYFDLEINMDQLQLQDEDHDIPHTAWRITTVNPNESYRFCEMKKRRGNTTTTTTSSSSSNSSDFTKVARNAFPHHIIRRDTKKALDNDDDNDTVTTTATSTETNNNNNNDNSSNHDHDDLGDLSHRHQHHHQSNNNNVTISPISYSSHSHGTTTNTRLLDQSSRTAASAATASTTQKKAAMKLRVEEFVMRSFYNEDCELYHALTLEQYLYLIEYWKSNQIDGKWCYEVWSIQDDEDTKPWVRLSDLPTKLNPATMNLAHFGGQIPATGKYPPSEQGALQSFPPIVRAIKLPKNASTCGVFDGEQSSSSVLSTTAVATSSALDAASSSSLSSDGIVFVDLTLNTKCSNTTATSLHDAIYNAPQVLNAGIHNFNDDDNKETQLALDANEKEIQVVIWDESKQTAFHTFSLEDLKTTSTLQLYELVPKSFDPIPMVFLCVDAIQVSDDEEEL